MYVRKVDGQKLTFQVSGKLWMRSLVMSDAETGTEWAHQLGKAMKGKLKGKELKPIISDMVSWSSWKKRYPETTVLNMSRTASDFSTDMYRRASRFVLGFKANGDAFSVSMEDIAKKKVHSFDANDEQFVVTFDSAGGAIYLFSGTLDGKNLDFESIDDGTMQDQQTQSTWSIVSGKALSGKLKGQSLDPLIGIMSFGKAWNDFHPSSKNIDF